MNRSETTLIHFRPLFSTENHFKVYKHQESQQEEIKTKKTRKSVSFSLNGRIRLQAELPTERLPPEQMEVQVVHGLASVWAAVTK